MSPLHTVSRLPQPHTRPPSWLGSPQSHTCRRELVRPGPQHGPTPPTIRNLKLLGALGSATPGTAFPEGGGGGAPRAPPPLQPPAPVAQGQGGGGERLGGGWGRSPRPLCAAPRAFALRLLPARPGSGGGEGRARQPGRESRSGRAPVTPSPLSPLGKGAGSTGTQEFGIPRKE